MIARKSTFVLGQYAVVPQPVMMRPALRGRKQSARYLLSAFEFTVSMGILREARTAWLEEQHQASLLAGKNAIAHEGQDAERYRQELKEANLARRRYYINGREGKKPKLPKRHHGFSKTFASGEFQIGHGDTYRPMSLDKAIRKAGGKAYASDFAEKKRTAPIAPVELRCQPYRILQAAMLSTDGKNIGALEDALGRLCRPTQDADFRFPPVLLDFHRRPNGEYHLVVNPDWMPITSFGRIPLPLPTRSPVAISLFIFLRSISTSRTNNKTIDFGTLCRIVGIETKWGQAAAQRILDTALEVLNKHLSKMDPDVLKDDRIELPGRYEVHSQGERIRFVGVSVRRRQVEAEMEDEAELEVLEDA